MTLPQSVKDAVKFADAECGKSSDFTFDMSGADWQTIRAHLLSQEAEISNLRDDRDSWLDQASQRLEDWDDMRRRAESAESRIAAANERLEAAERDAARYRWLRSGDSRLAVCDEDTSYYLEQLDAIVDAATQEGEE